MKATNPNAMWKLWGGHDDAPSIDATAQWFACGKRPQNKAFVAKNTIVIRRGNDGIFLLYTNKKQNMYSIDH